MPKKEIKKTKHELLLEKIEEYCFKVEIINGKRTVMSKIRDEKALAKEANITPVTLSNIKNLNGKKEPANPKLSTMKSLAKALKCNYWEIF